VSGIDKEKLREKIIKVLKEIYDPEIPVNVYDLGLIYDLRIEDEGIVYIKMTLTSPGCPVAGLIVMQTEAAVREVEGVKDVKIELVWDPPWSPRMITPEGREQLKMLFGYDVVEKWIKQYEAQQAEG
jgi:FeS assembly SUF system protein